jgi:uncharacterized membrane protein
MRWLTAGVVLGIGIGGLVDGIALHQIMQWHNMGSSVLPPVTMQAMSQNMVWDGVFHAVTLAITLVGLYMLWSDGHRQQLTDSATQFTGQLVFGWGLFNLVEGVIDHHVLELHHVRDLPVYIPSYDWTFLAVGGLGFLALGLVLMRARGRRSMPRASV